jgi:hypothetical protein
MKLSFRDKRFIELHFGISPAIETKGPLACAPNRFDAKLTQVFHGVTRYLGHFPSLKVGFMGMNDDEDISRASKDGNGKYSASFSPSRHSIPHREGPLNFGRWKSILAFSAALPNSCRIHPRVR